MRVRTSDDDGSETDDDRTGMIRLETVVTDRVLNRVSFLIHLQTIFPHFENTSSISKSRLEVSVVGGMMGYGESSPVNTRLLQGSRLLR